MRYLVKGDAMESGGRLTAQAIAPSGRYAVGLFGGGRHDDGGKPHSLHTGRRPILPPRTLVLIQTADR